VNDWDLQAATPNPALHLTKAIIMREEPGAMQQSCRTAPHKQQTCVLISFCWTCI